MKLTPILILLLFSFSTKAGPQQESSDHLKSVLDAINISEQEPIRRRDSLMRIYGVESELVEVQQAIYRKNHVENEQIVRAILDKTGWPELELVGETGNRTICNVLQHSDSSVRIHYLPMMQEAVRSKQLSPQLLVRAEDRIATDRGELQIYGGQMKYYPETKSFNVWPVYDPVNIDKRRVEIGLGPIAEYLKNRFDFEWNLEEQIKRTEKFLAEKSIQDKK